MRRLTIPIGESAHDRAVAGGTDQHVVSPFRVVAVCTLLIGVMMLCVLPWSSGRMSFLMNLVIGGRLSAVGSVVLWRSRSPAVPTENSQ